MIDDPIFKDPLPVGPEAEPASFLLPTPTVDSDHAEVRRFAMEAAGDTVPGGVVASDPREAARRLFYAVRDGIRYDPYSIALTVEELRASTTLATRRGWCVPKAALLAACCRAVGIPARLGFADVRNHLSTERLRAFMKTDVFVWHGYTSIHLGGRWVKATPAFNVELCERMRLRKLEFDGLADALLQPFDLDGHQHMEYLRDRGEYADIPVAALLETILQTYGNPSSGAEPGPDAAGLKGADFEEDVARENPRT